MLDIADGNYEAGVDSYEFSGMVAENVVALVAASFPAKPPGDWFTDPKFRQLSPLVIDNDGHVHGHIASWKQSHIGMGGSVRAPKSRSEYAFFQTGALETDTGKMVNVGQITLAGGHAALDASVAEAVAHYDNTKSAVMDVAVGEDRHGIWVAGSLRPDVDEGSLRSIRASSVSGDWRPINGNLELVAVCAVNVPGFPIPRARVASGEPIALVAAGTEPLVKAAIFRHAGFDTEQGVQAGLGILENRITRVEHVLTDRVRTRREKIAPEVEVIRTAPVRASADDLRARVHHNGPEPLWTDGFTMSTDINEAVVASLRNRAKGITATATKEWTADKRKEAAKKGWSLKDGSFPIKDEADVAKAVSAAGRSSHTFASVKRHICRRAKAINATSSLPDGWAK